MTAKWILPVIVLTAAFAADRRPVPWEKNQIQTGQALYREHCVVCHDIDQQQSKKYGPSFYQLFKRDRMPIMKAKPNREYIKVRVKFGGALMPAFKDKMTDAQIDVLMGYIATK